MIPNAFEYHSPATVDEALALLDEHGDEAKLLAGGHSLIPLMKLRLAAPGHLIDLARIDGLSYIRDLAGAAASGSGIAIGAMTTHNAVATSEIVRGRLAVLAEATAAIGDPQVRNRGTIGGSVAHADPGADLPGVMLALNAELVLRGPNGVRAVPAAEFFVDLFTTAIAPGELLTEIRIPALPARSGSTYLKLPNQASGYAIVGIAAIVTLDGNVISDARVGISGVAETAKRAGQTEAALRGKPATSEMVKQAAQYAGEDIEPLGDMHASAEYRSHLVRVYTLRALLTAIERAGG